MCAKLVKKRPSIHLRVLHGSQSKQRLFLYNTLTGWFYYRGRQCLLRRTNWVFKSDRYSFILKGLNKYSHGPDFVAFQEIYRILQTLKVHYRVHNSPFPSPHREPHQYSLRSFIPFLEDSFQYYPIYPRSSQWIQSLRFPHRNPVCTSPVPHTRRKSHPSHSLFHHLMRNANHEAPHYVISCSRPS